MKRKSLRLPSGAFRHVGEYQIDIHLHTDVNATINIEVSRGRVKL